MLQLQLWSLKLLLALACDWYLLQGSRPHNLDNGIEEVIIEGHLFQGGQLPSPKEGFTEITHDARLWSMVGHRTVVTVWTSISICLSSFGQTKESSLPSQIFSPEHAQRGSDLW